MQTKYATDSKWILPASGDIHKYTWRQPTRNLKTIIDYIITRKKQNKTIVLNVQNVRVCRGATYGSEHYFDKAKIMFSGRKKAIEPTEDMNSQLTQTEGQI